jgi:6-phosphofructokinase 1
MANNEYEIPSLGKRTVKSPLNLSQTEGDGLFEYVTDEDRVVYDTTLHNYIKCRDEGELPVSFEKAGPRQQIFFEPAKTKVAIVTCGGLCPGLNNVIRSLVLTLWQRYNVKRIVGVQYGYEGFISKYNHPLVDLDPEKVDKIHTEGGTILGSSRGEQNIEEIVDALEVMNVNILFCIGGDGTLRGAQAITEEIAKRNLKIAVGGIPKTIDNDISMIDRSFGFETACSIATEIIYSGHNEAHGAYNGIALIKLMGRDSGFIAAHAALSNQEVNFVLIPEMDFELYGGRGFLKVLRKRLEDRHHAVIVVAEGAGQHLFEDRDIITKDVSGNAKYKDIGIFLKEKIHEEFDNKDFPYSLKYIDPSYIIRSAPANPQDSKFCLQLAQHAVHAAMGGKTGFVVGNRSGMFTLLPIPIAVKQRKKIDLQSELWFNVLEATGQPATMKN